MRFLLRALRREVLGLDRQWLLAVASTLLASNLITNTYVVARVFSPDGYLLPTTARLILVFNAISVALAIALGIAAWKLPDFRVSLKLYQLILAFVMLESFLRINMFTDLVNIRWLKNPRLYTTGVCGDDAYYVLAHYYHDAPPAVPVDPGLGWTQGTGPLKIIGGGFSDPAEVRDRPVLFFGDSFVAQGGGEGYKIPEILDRELPEHDVLNFGVPGYATDQISLRFQQVYPEFASKRPIVLIGTMLNDLDRSLLEYRQAQKPYFELAADGPVLRAPRFETNEEYVDRFRFADRSFALAPILTLGARLLASESWCSEQRLEINRVIFAGLRDFAARHAVDFHVVVMYNQNDLTRVSPMERELFSILEELEFERIVDTKPLLLREMENGAKIEDLYHRGSHHTSRANRAIASGIARYLEAIGRD